MNWIDLKSTLKTIFKDTNRVNITLLKIMVPTLIVVALLDYFGFTKYVGEKIGPFLQLIGLPASAGLVWAATLFTNIYTGLAVFTTQQNEIVWTQAQVTILGTLMLVAHNFPIEVSVAKRAGCRIWFNILLRLGGALILCALLNIIFRHFNIFQNPAEIKIPQFEDSQILIQLSNILNYIFQIQGVSRWVANQIINCIQIYFVIMALIAIIKFLRYVGIEKIISTILQPLFRLLRIKPTAISITIVGITLGLAYGGGLLIQEAESGKIEKEDVFASVSFLSLCHSQIEDTFLIMLMGAHLSGILFARLIFALLVVYIVMQLKLKVSAEFSDKFLVTNASKS